MMIGPIWVIPTLCEVLRRSSTMKTINEYVQIMLGEKINISSVQIVLENADLFENTLTKSFYLKQGLMVGPVLILVGPTK